MPIRQIIIFRIFSKFNVKTFYYLLNLRYVGCILWAENNVLFMGQMWSYTEYKVREMNRITSIRIDWFCCGLTCGEFVVHQALSVYRNKKQIAYRGYSAVNRGAVVGHEVKMDALKCEELFSLLERAEEANEFEQDIIPELVDGFNWEMRLRHSDKKIKMIIGNIDLPAHGREIEKYIRESFGQTLIQIDPMIFGGAI